MHGVDLYEAANHNLKLIHVICRDIDEIFFIHKQMLPKINNDFLGNHENIDVYIISISNSAACFEWIAFFKNWIVLCMNFMHYHNHWPNATTILLALNSPELIHFTKWIFFHYCMKHIWNISIQFVLNSFYLFGRDK